MSNPLKTTDLTNLQNRINSIRSSFGLSSTSFTSKKTKTLASDIIELKTSIQGLKSNTYLSHANYDKIDNLNVSAGDPWKKQVIDDLQSQLTSLEGVCANNSTTANNTYTQGDSTLSQQCSTCSETCETMTTTYSTCTANQTRANTNTVGTNSVNNTSSQSACPTSSDTNRTTGVYSYSGDATSCKTYYHSNSTNAYDDACHTSQVSYSENSVYSNCSQNTVDSTYQNSTNNNYPVANTVCQTNTVGDSTTTNTTCKTYSQTCKTSYNSTYTVA